MKHFLSISLLIASVTFYSCTHHENQEVDSAKTAQTSVQHAVGMCSPIQLNYGVTQVDLADYILDIELIDSIVYQNSTLVQEGNVVQLPAATNSIETLNLYFSDELISIPVFASEKTEVDFNFIPPKDAKKVQLAGDINGWNPSATELVQSEDTNMYSVSLVLDPGEYKYQIVVDGEWMLDPNNPNSASNGMGGMNSVLHVGENTSSDLFLTSLKSSSSGVELQCNEPAVHHVFWNNQLIYESTQAEATVSIEIPEKSMNEARSFLRAFASNSKTRGNDVLIPITKGKVIENADELSREDHHQMIMYFALIDRFKNGDKGNDHPVDNDSILPIANHLGGDFTGINQALNNGYFEELGVNTIWVSPITQNPEGAWGLWDKGTTSKFSGYHGYWPVTSTSIDYRYGTPETFTKLIDDLHKNDMNILVDYVANHVHQEHNVYQEHPDWATPLYLPDGTMNTEKWDEYRLTTWFDTFLPTLDFSREEVVEAMTDSALFWFENYQIDGFRHDATKHIPESFWKTLTRKTKERIIVPEHRAVYQIGETYGNPELISSYVSSGQLDGQFDFNLYDAMVRTFAMEDEPFDNLVRVLKQSIKYYGAHHKMGNISGNQDRARFASYADGAVKFEEDPKLAGWTRAIEPIGDLGHKRSEMLHAFLLSVPGIPCIYYGDEIAMPGANDPDNRRMMHFDDWNDLEKGTFENMSALIELRKSRMSMIYGDLKIDYHSDDVLVFSRTYLGEKTTCIFTKNSEAYRGNVNVVLAKVIDLEKEQVILAESDTELFGSGMHYRIIAQQ